MLSTATSSTAHSACLLLHLQFKCVQTVKSNYQEDAKSATKQEIWDNCSCWVPKAIHMAQQSRHGVLVSWDNASFHNFNSYGGVTRLGLADAQHLVLPAQSPDLHQIIEHCFARLKQQLVALLYKLGWDNVTPQVVADVVLQLCRGDTVASAAIIKAELHRLPKLYRVLSTPKGQQVFDGSRHVQGCGGDWPPKGYR